MNFKEQFRRNAVALTSLAIAITSLGYNTWRNEASESNRTDRLVALEILVMLGALQQVTWHHHYDKDFDDKGNLRTGWSHVLVIRDISQILDSPLPAATQLMYEAWNTHSDNLDTSVKANDAIIDSIENVRVEVRQLLAELD